MLKVVHVNGQGFKAGEDGFRILFRFRRAKPGEECFVLQTLIASP